MMEKTPDKGILEKLKEKKRFGPFISSSTNPKYLIAYSRLRPYINPKTHMGMPVLAIMYEAMYGHDSCHNV
jgi:hypothetical protein